MNLQEVDVCVTVHHQYKDVSNQQDAKNFSFIRLFRSALHVPGDKFAHPQEHFLTVCTAFGTMHRHCCRLAAVSVNCTKSCIYSQKVLLRMGEFVARNRRDWFKILINEKVVASCWLLTSLSSRSSVCVCVCVRVCARARVCRKVWTRIVWPSIRPMVDFVKTALKLLVA
jgi:hypothetical protein